MLLAMCLEVALMGHPDFRVREAAFRRLDSRGDEALLALRLGHSDPEVNARCRVLLENRVARLRPTRYGRMPWLDELPDQQERGVMLEKYMRTDMYQPLGDDWPGYRVATGAYIRDLYLRQGWSRGRIVALLDRMAESEIRTCQRIGKGSLIPEYAKAK